MTETLVEELKQRSIPILRRHQVIQASLFGSFARGDASASSDLDILVEMPETKSLLDLVALKLDLEEALDRQVDVLTYRALHPLIRDSVLQDQVSILVPALWQWCTDPA